MSLLWADDFKTFGTGSVASGAGGAYMLNGLYAEMDNGPTGPGSGIGITDDPDPIADPSSVAVFMSSGNYDKVCRKVLDAGAKTTVGASIRVWMPRLPNAAAETIELFSWRDINNAAHLSLYVLTTGALAIARGGYGGTVLGTSTAAVLTANAWHHVEAKVTINDTTGATEVRVNGTVVAGLTLTGQDTADTAVVSCYQIAVVKKGYVTSNGVTFYFRDMVIWDTAGSYNNNFFGPCMVERRTVVSDVSFNWSASTGSTGYNLLDEAGPNDADYISATVAQTTQCEFGVEDLPADVTSVRGMILLGRMWASDGGDCKVQMGVKSAGDQGLGTDRQITTAPTYWFDVVETSPDTGVPFTPTEFNAMTLTVDRTV